MKINADFYLTKLKVKFEDINIIFLFGSNLGLVELLFKKTLEILKIDLNDPFSVSKIDGNEFKDNPSILFDNISTLSIFSDTRFIILDLMYISITKNIENIILEAIEKNNNNYLLIIKGGNIKQTPFVKHFQILKNSYLVPCYEENSDTIGSLISSLFSKHKLNFKKDFLNNLALRFNSDSLTNKMEIDKLDAFLTNNTYVTEEMILNLVSENTDINFDKILEYCTKGNPERALAYYNNFYENQSTTITLIRIFVNHFKLIEKLLLLTENDSNLKIVIEKASPPIFFKKKEFIISQCKLWNLKSINIILKRLIELELKCKLNQISEKTLMSQFILSTSVLAGNKIKT